MIKLVVILGLVVLATLGALAIGATRGDGDPAAVIRGLQASVGGLMTAQLRTRDLRPNRPDCQIQGNRLRVPQGFTCRFTVPRGGLRVRVGRVERASGQGGVCLVLRPSQDPRPEASEDDPLCGDTALDLSVYKEGGALLLNCTGADDCVFVLGRGGR